MKTKSTNGVLGLFRVCVYVVLLINLFLELVHLENILIDVHRMYLYIEFDGDRV